MKKRIFSIVATGIVAMGLLIQPISANATLENADSPAEEVTSVTIGDSAFDACRRFPLPEEVIGTTIGNDAFGACHGLTIPEEVTGDSACENSSTQPQEGITRDKCI